MVVFALSAAGADIVSVLTSATEDLIVQVPTPEASVVAAHPVMVLPVPFDVKLADTPLMTTLSESFTVIVHVEVVVLLAITGVGEHAKVEVAGSAI